MVYKRSAFSAAELRLRSELDGAQDYDLILRLSKACSSAEIVHVPWVLYHWRMHPNSTAMHSAAKPYTEAAGQAALSEMLGEKATIGYLGENRFRVSWQAFYRDQPLISIVIPSRDQPDLLSTCIQSIVDKTRYKHYEIVVIDNGSEELYTHLVLQKLVSLPVKIQIVSVPGDFNWSHLNNVAKNYCSGELLLFLNDDTEVIHQEWLEELGSEAWQPTAGCVGAKLLYEDGSIQHAGVFMTNAGPAHGHRGFPLEHPGYYSRLLCTYDVLAVTGACLMLRREVFDAVNGFDTDYAVAYGDIDFCLRILELGYLNIFVPFAILLHHESRSRGYETDGRRRGRLQTEMRRFQARWVRYLGHDPYYNPHLTHESDNYALNPEYGRYPYC